jgi:hypothetical protein
MLLTEDVTQQIICSSRIVIIDFGECYDAHMDGPRVHSSAISLNNASLVGIINEYLMEWSAPVTHLLDEKGQGIGGAQLFLAPEARLQRDRYVHTILQYKYLTICPVWTDRIHLNMRRMISTH